MKLDFLNKQEVTKNKYSFVANLYERYTVENPLKSIPYDKLFRYILFIGLRVISPISSFKFSLPDIKMYTVYQNNELDNLILEYMNKKEGINFKQLRDCPRNNSRLSK